MTVQYYDYLHGIDTGQFAKNVDIFSSHFQELIKTQNELYVNLNTHRILLYDILGDDTGVLRWKTSSTSYPVTAPFMSRVETSYKSGGTPVSIALKAYILLKLSIATNTATIRFRSDASTVTTNFTGAGYTTLSWQAITGFTSTTNTLDTFLVDALVSNVALSVSLYGAIIVEAF